MGRGLVNPVDDVRATNPASNEELLAALTKDFVAHKFDVKYLIRTIMNSSVYQLQLGSQRDQSERQHVLLAVHHQAAAGRSDSGRVLAGDRRAHRVSRAIPPARGPCNLPDTQVKSEFLTIFGRPGAIALRLRRALLRSHHRARRCMSSTATR